jgi:uncharacterized protein YbjT (DUF2867 family)
MKVIVFGASGMVGQGVVRECLLDDSVEKVLSVVRAPTGETHAKLEELVHKDFFEYASVEDKLKGYDACFFCLGVSAAGMKEDQYRHLTYDLTLTAAQTLARLNPSSTFIYVSGAGTDSTEQKGAMWARVKGKTENDLLKLPFKSAYMFRPGMIRPMHGARSKTRGYRIFYTLAWPFMPIFTLFPGLATTTERLGRAMLAVAKNGNAERVVTNREIDRIGRAAAAVK